MAVKITALIIVTTSVMITTYVIRFIFIVPTLTEGPACCYAPPISEGS